MNPGVKNSEVQTNISPIKPNAANEKVISKRDDVRVRIKSERMNLTQFRSEKRNISKLIFGSHVERKTCECMFAVALESQSNNHDERD